MQVKEKEQENRISKLKIKDLRRQLKHNQLQPLQSSSIDQSIISTINKNVESSSININQSIVSKTNKTNRMTSKPPLLKNHHGGVSNSAVRNPRKRDRGIVDQDDLDNPMTMAD